MEPQPKDTPNEISSQQYFYWAKKEEWTLEQAAQLAVGLLPLLPYQQRGIEFNNETQEIRYNYLLLSLEETMKKEKIAPSDFFMWVNRKKINAPKVLIKQIKEVMKINKETDKYVFNAKEQHSMLLMFGAIIKNTYQKESIPYAKDSLTTDIKHDLALLGVHIDDATILKFIRLSDSALKGYLSEHAHD